MADLPELWAHQKQAIERAKTQPDYALFFEMGTGKSRTALEVLRFRMNENKRILRTLIIGPLAVLYNWRNEIQKFTKIPIDKVFVLDGPVADRVKLIQVLPKETIFIMNYEAFANVKVTDIFAASPPEFLILDESQRIKNHTAKRTKALIKLSDQMQNLPVKYRMILTGTPVLNNEIDLFSQFRVLDSGKRLGKNFFQFRAQYFEDKNKFMPKHAHFPKWVAKPDTREKLKNIIAQASMAVNKEDCLDLPPLIKTEMPVKMSAEQKRAYEDMKKEFIAFCSSGAAVAQLAITKVLRMQQILSGFLKLENGSIHRFDSNPRAAALEEILEDIPSTSKVIIWSVFHEDHATIKNVCDSLKIKYVTLTGETKDKQAEIDSFQNDPSIRVIIASQAAGGVGVNLTAASYMVYYSRNYSLEQDLQSEARAYRGGSEIHSRITRIDLIAEGTVEVDILAALRAKKDLSKDILQIAKLTAGL